jgi:GGDEF domain-containing protein
MRKGRAMKGYHKDAIHKPRSDPLCSTVGNAHWSPEDARTVAEILAEADTKMYGAKHRHSNGKV